MGQGFAQDISRRGGGGNRLPPQLVQGTGKQQYINLLGKTTVITFGTTYHLEECNTLWGEPEPARAAWIINAVRV